MKIIVDGINYELNKLEKTANVIENKNIVGQVVIPETIEHESIKYTVDTIGDAAFYKCINMQKISLPSTITNIESLAFCGCQSLVIEALPKNLNEIGSNVFSDCKSLKSIKIPNSLKVIDRSIFLDCTNLEEVIFEESSVLTEIPYSMFSGCESLKNIILPQNLVSIGSFSFRDCISLSNIIFPNTVKFLGECSFENCTLLNNIKFENKNLRIAPKCFYNCKSLSNIELPEGLKIIETNSFKNCKALGNITLPSTIEKINDFAFESYVTINVKGKDSSEVFGTLCEKILIEQEGLKYVIDFVNKTAYLGRNRSAKGDVVVRSSVDFKGITYQVNIISSCAFESCDTVNSIIISEGITEIKKCSFHYCTELKKVQFPSTLTKTASTIFYECCNIEEVICGKGTNLNVINSIFDYSTKLKYVCLDQEDLFRSKKLSKYIFRYVSENSNLYDIEKIKLGLKKKKDLLISLMSSLDTTFLSFIFDNNICSYELAKEMNETLELNTECKTLFLNYLSNATIEEKNEFKKSLRKKEDIEIGLESCTLKDIKSEWKCSKKDNRIHFKGYTGVKNSVTIPACIDGISSYVFEPNHSSSSLTELIFADGLKELEIIVINHKEVELFSNVINLKKIILPQSLTNLVCIDKLPVRINLQSKTNEGNLEEVTYFNDVLFSLGDENIEDLNVKEGTKVIRLYNCSKFPNLKSVTIPSSVEIIGYNSFFRCNSLTDVIIKEGTRVIEHGAFYDCKSLRNLTLPKTLKVIDYSAFTYCKSLTNIILPDSIEKIASGVFSNCDSLESIKLSKNIQEIGWKTFYNCTSLTEIIIPEGVTKIRSEAFFGCTSLTSITLPSTLESIGESAFEGCESLKNIIIPKSVTNLDKRSFGHCYALENVEIHNESIVMHETSFRACKALKNKPKK